MIDKNFNATVFGATSLLGKSIIKFKPKKFVYISRKKINQKKIKSTQRQTTFGASLEWAQSQH